jgi:hypothetical protein
MCFACRPLICFIQFTVNALPLQSCLSWARESEADYMSPVVASMSCSPQPAALHIAPAARLWEFCLYDFAHGELLCL